MHLEFIALHSFLLLCYSLFPIDLVLFSYSFLSTVFEGPGEGFSQQQKTGGFLSMRGRMKFQDTSHTDILISETLKQMVLLILRSPRRYKMEEAQERKSLICISVGRVSRQEWLDGAISILGLGVVEIHGQQGWRATKAILEATKKASWWLGIKKGDLWQIKLPAHTLGTDRSGWVAWKRYT